MKQEEKQYNFFISHASEDKDSFVSPLAEKLIEEGYRIWYDEMSLNVGDSLVENISNGIKKSTYGIVILSKNFFKKKWTKKELNVLLNKEIISESNLILPVWLDVGLDEVFDFSPFLVDKLAIPASAEKIDDVVLRLGKKIKLEHTSQAMVKEKIEYLIDCNDDRRNKYFLDLEKRIKSIFLYQQEYYNWYTSDDVFNNDNPWDDILVDKKGKELAAEYGLVQGIWLNTEPFPWGWVEKTVKLCSKWVFRKMNFGEAIELHYLLDELLDSDVYYVLYGFTHLSMEAEAAEEAEEGVFEIGIKNEIKRGGSQKEYDAAIKRISDRYYG